MDTERGTVFLRIGNPVDSFYGADRKGTNLYPNAVVALDALTGKLKWHYRWCITTFSTTISPRLRR